MKYHRPKLRPILVAPTSSTYDNEEFIPPPTAPMIRIDRIRSHSAPQKPSRSSKQKQFSKKSPSKKEIVSDRRSQGWRCCCMNDRN